MVWTKMNTHSGEERYCLKNCKCNFVYHQGRSVIVANAADLHDISFVGMTMDANA